MLYAAEAQNSLSSKYSRFDETLETMYCRGCGILILDLSFWNNHCFCPAWTTNVSIYVRWSKWKYATGKACSSLLIHIASNFSCSTIIKNMLQPGQNLLQCCEFVNYTPKVSGGGQGGVGVYQSLISWMGVESLNCKCSVPPVSQINCINRIWPKWELQVVEWSTTEQRSLLMGLNVLLFGETKKQHNIGFVGHKD